MFDPAEVAAWKTKSNPPSVLPPVSNSQPTKQQAQLPAPTSNPKRNPVPIEHRVFLSLPEAAYRSGLMLLEIEELVKEGKLPIRERKVGNGVRPPAHQK
jgi:hypothetical protein